jgi:hypothetical protein
VLKRWSLAALISFAPLSAYASNYLFLNDDYIQQTRVVLTQADAQAPSTFDKGSPAEAKYVQAVAGLRQQLDAISHAETFKKLKPELVAEVKDQQFADNLNTFKFALNAMATKAGKTPTQLFPAYEKWVQTEAAVVSTGIDQRLKAFETRFGPDSEQINFLELFTGEFFFRGDESAPSPWEPITRLSAIQATTAGPGLVSSFELGMNYYFLEGVPSPLSMVGISNHLGVAASLQYLNDPHLLHFEGRPSLGLMLHLDRKEAGLSWDPDRHNVRITLGYAVQFIPFLM